MSPQRRALVERLVAERYAPSPRPVADLLDPPTGDRLPPVTDEQATANRRALEDAIGGDPHLWGVA